MAEKAHTSSEGWVYLIVNDQMSRHVKIGKTDRDPIERARELVSTGTVGTFVVIYQAWVRDPYAVEQRVHRTLSRHRKDGEWFDVCPNVAKQEIHSAAGEVQFEKVTPRWHPSQREPALWTKVFLDEARLAAEVAERSRQADEKKKEADRLAEQKAEEDRKKQEQAEQERKEREAIERRLKEEEERRERWRLMWQKLVRAAPLLLLLMVLSGVLSYAAYLAQSPYPEAELRIRRSVVADARKRVLQFDEALLKVRKEIAEVEQSIETLPTTRAAVKKWLDEADARRRKTYVRLQYMRGLWQEYEQGPRPRVSRENLRIHEQALTAGVKEAEAQHSAATTEAATFRAEFEALPTSSAQQARLKTLRLQEAELRRDKDHQMRLVASGSAAAAAAERHNEYWAKKR